MTLRSHLSAQVVSVCHTASHPANGCAEGLPSVGKAKRCPDACSHFRHSLVPQTKDVTVPDLFFCESTEAPGKSHTLPSTHRHGAPPKILQNPLALPWPSVTHCDPAGLGTHLGLGPQLGLMLAMAAASDI